MGAIEQIAGGLGAVADLFDKVTPDFGDVVEDVCDALLPEVVGDVVSLGLNIVGGNYAAAVADGLDLLENVARGSPDGASRGEPDVDPGPPPDETLFLAREDGAAPPAPPQPGRAGGAPIDDSFWGQSDDQLTRAIRNGAIPQEVLESKEGMLRLQQRMNDIQQMNALMTNMLRVMHDMEMEIIRHVRA